MQSSLSSNSAINPEATSSAAGFCLAASPPCRAVPGSRGPEHPTYLLDAPDRADRVRRRSGRIFISPSDLAASLGHSRDQNAPRVIKAMEDAIGRARRANRSACSPAHHQPTFARRCINLGTTFTAIGVDMAGRNAAPTPSPSPSPSPGPSHTRPRRLPRLPPRTRFWGPLTPWSSSGGRPRERQPSAADASVCASPVARSGRKDKPATEPARREELPRCGGLFRPLFRRRSAPVRRPLEWGDGELAEVADAA
ncbi:aldolase/citrate lyase family protein [Streptomyces sp. NPDC002144]